MPFTRFSALLAAALSLSLVSTGCIFGSDESKGRVYSNGIYTDHPNRFTLKTPTGWDVVLYGGFPWEVDAIFFPDSAVKTAPFAKVEHNPTLKPGVTAEDYVDSQMVRDSTYVREDVRVRQGIALHAIHHTTRETVLYKVRYVYFSLGRTLVTITFVDTASTFDTREEFRSIDSSLTFF